MDRRRAAGALLALAACIACSTAAPTASNQTALELLEGPSEGCYYNFQHYGEGDRIMTNEPCLNCTCHNRMLMCYLKVCPFTKPIGQDCTIEKRADQCCPIVTCPDVPVDLLTSTSTTSPAEYGATGLGKVDKYGCSINGKYFPEGSKVPPAPNKPCEHCYCIRNMTTCVMQECTLHVDGCTPIYNKDVCCPVRYSCDHQEDEMLLLDDMTTTVRPTPGFLLTTTTMPSVTQISQNCVHDDQIFADGALIKTEIACEHCYCMKGDIVCVVQECGTPMENEGKNCTSLPPRQGQCCPDTYICEGDELVTETTTGITLEELTTLSPPRRVEGSGYRNEPDEPYTEISTFEGSGEEHATTLDSTDMFTTQKQTPPIIDETFVATEESIKPSLTTAEPDKEQNTVPDDSDENAADSQLLGKTTLAQEITTTIEPIVIDSIKETATTEYKTTISDYHQPSETDSFTPKDEFVVTTESTLHYTEDESNKITEIKPEIETETTEFAKATSPKAYSDSSSPETSTTYSQETQSTTVDISKLDDISEPKVTTPEITTVDSEEGLHKKEDQDISLTHEKESTESVVTTTVSIIEPSETTPVNPVENEIDEDIVPPGRIPGEGDCLLNGVTYKNNTNVPNINNCHSSCKCISSIVKCDPIICSPPPENMDNMNDCQPIYDTPDACCPTYVCHSRETIPPESHSQMSGTESPKPSPESECHGEECQPHESKPIQSEICNSADCKPGTEYIEKECKNGVCENTDTNINLSYPPQEHPEACVGDSCLPTKEICTGEKCQQPTHTDTICDSDNGCKPSEPCKGTDCAVGSDVAMTTDELPMCNDSEDCKVSDTSSCKGSSCDTTNEDKEIENEITIISECTEENCRRKEHTQDTKSPSGCSGSSCITQAVEGGSSDLTTELTIKDQLQTESTTEIINVGYSEAPEIEETPSGETQKVTLSEATTEYQDTSPGQSTDKSDSLTEHISETATEQGESDTGSLASLATKMEETATEIYTKPESVDDQTNIPETNIPESKDTVTEPQSTELPHVTHYEEHSTDSPKQDVTGTPFTSVEISTQTSINEPQDNEKNEDDVTESSIIEKEETQEVSTKPTSILETTSKLLETDVPEYTEKQEETYTKSPGEQSTPFEVVMPHVIEKEEPTKILTDDNVNTETQPDVSVTESFETLSPEMSTEKHLDSTIKDDITPPEIHIKDTDITEQITTEQPVQDQKSSELPDVKLDESTTDKIDEKLEDHTPTSGTFTAAMPSETTAHEQHEIKEPDSPQIIDMESLPENVDITTESSIKDQEHVNIPTEIIDIVTDIQDTYTTPAATQEYVSSIGLVTHATQPTATEEILVTQMHEISPQKDESNLPESAVKESPTSPIPQQVDMEDITTQQADKSITDIYEEVTTGTIQKHDDSLSTVSDLTLEVHTESPIKEIFQEDTTQRVIEPQEKDTTTGEQEITSKPTTTGLSTTISLMIPDEDQESSTKYTETDSSVEPSGESTLLPEIHYTKSEEPTSLLDETEKKTLETSTTSGVGSEAITTDSLKQPQVDESKMPDFTQTNDLTQEPSIESTSAPTISHTEGHADYSDKTIPVAVDLSITKEEPQFTTPDTIKQYTEKEDTMLPHDEVTEGIKNDITGTDSGEYIHQTTEYTASNEMEPHNIVTHASAMTTQSEGTETKLTTEIQTDHEMTTTTAEIIKTEKEQTESPLSLVTGVQEHTYSEDTRDSIIDKTTEASQTKIPDDEKIKTTKHYDTQPQISYTESPQLPPETEIKPDTETPPQIHPDKEEQPEKSSTISSPEYTTLKVLGVDDKEKTPATTESVYMDISTEVSEKIVPTNDYQDIIKITQSPTKIDTELYSTEVVHESTPVVPVISSSEESFATKEQDISTAHPEISNSMTTVIYDYEPSIKPEKIPETEHIIEDGSEQPQQNVESTTADSRSSEILKEDNEGIKESEETISPELLTTKYPVTFDKTEDKPIDELKPSKHDEYTLIPEQHVTTERVIYTVTPNVEMYSPIDQDQDKPTELQVSGEKDVTTLAYQDLVTLHETDGTKEHITTESSDILPSEESNRRTLSPSLETVEPEQLTTEKQKIVELSEITKGQEIEQTDTTQEISSNTPEKETVTLPMNEEFDGVTLIPQYTTEGDIPLHTETISPYEDQKEHVATENIDKQTVKAQDVTLKPDIETDDRENLHAEVPLEKITETDKTADVTTVYDDLIKITTGHTVAQESQTETSMLKETEMSTSTETKAESDISVPIETDIHIPKTTEPSLVEDTEITISKETESSVPEITEASVPKSTETSGNEVTLATVHEINEVTATEVTEIDESFKVPDVTKVSASEVTQASVPEVTEASAAEVTQASVPEVTEASAAEVTQASVSELTEASIPEETESSVFKITDVTEHSPPGVTKATSAEVTEATVTEINEEALPEITEAPVTQGTESAVTLSDTSISKETESGVFNREPESTTYKPKDEAPIEQSPTLEPTYSSSETTPYLVELQEHTTKVDEDISLVTLIEEDRTKAPETYQTERGDQPLDTFPDKFTQPESHEEYTTKQTFTKKEEQLTTLPLEQASEYPEKITDKTDVATEEVLVSSETPVSTLLDSHIGQDITSSEPEGQSVTLSPTASATLKEHEKFTTAVYEVETTTERKDVPLYTEKIPDHEIMHEVTTSEDALISTATKASTTKSPEEITTHPPMVDDKFIKPEETPSESYSPTTAPELPKPGVNEIQSTDEIPSPDFPPSGSSGYGQEPDYVEEDQAFGPGTCRYGGKVYVSAQQIPRDDPCDFCFCFRSDIICLQQSCPPPIHGCHEEPIQGFCCPRYECPVSMATTLNVTTTTTTTTTTLPPHFLPHAYKGAAQRRGCQIKGHSYKVGEVVRASSGPCLHCTCGGDGQMKCDPKACTPEPMLRQMIAAAVSAKRRR